MRKGRGTRVVFVEFAQLPASNPFSWLEIYMVDRVHLSLQDCFCSVFFGRIRIDLYALFCPPQSREDSAATHPYSMFAACKQENRSKYFSNWMINYFLDRKMSAWWFSLLIFKNFKIQRCFVNFSCFFSLYFKILWNGGKISNWWPIFCWKLHHIFFNSSTIKKPI